MIFISWLVSNVGIAAVLALAATVVQRCLARPGIARIIWILALLKLVTPPFVSMPVSNVLGQFLCNVGLCSCDHQSWTQTLIRDRLPWLILGVWTIGATVSAWIAWRGWVRLNRLVKHASPAPFSWQNRADEIAEHIGLRYAPEVLIVPGQVPPLVVPGTSPRMLVPVALVDRLSLSQRDALLTHELTHIKRRDHLVRFLELAVGVAYWWLPFVGAMGRQLRSCEESCCDAAVLARLPQARYDYAALLLEVLDLADSGSTREVAHATAMSVASDLETRLVSILNEPSRPRVTRFAAVFIALAACSLLPCGVCYVPARPTTSVSLDGCESPGSSSVVSPPVSAASPFLNLTCPANDQVWLGCCRS